MTDVIRKRIRHVSGMGCDNLEVDKHTVEFQQVAAHFDIPGDNYTVEWFLDSDGPYLVEGPCGPRIRGVFLRERHHWIPVCFIPETWGGRYASRRVVADVQ